MLKSWLKSFSTRQLSNSTRQRGRNATRSSAAWIEMLEARTLLSAVTFDNVVATNNAGISQASLTAANIVMTPATMRHAYGADSIILSGGIQGTGVGQTIAIIDVYDDPNIIPDTAAFNSYYSLQQFNVAGGPTLTVLGQTGGARPIVDPDPDPDVGTRARLEEAMDVQWAHVMAPQANIILFEADSFYPSDLFTAVATAKAITGVSVVSMSFGAAESASNYGLSGHSSAYYDSVFTTPSGHGGITFVASTGDAGYPQYPATSPNVVAVGGTHLAVSGSNYASETVWNNASISGGIIHGGSGGGGLSAYETTPSYQASVNSSGYRSVPDISMDADGGVYLDNTNGVAVYDSYDGGGLNWYPNSGGTSLSAPLFAGLVAVIDQGVTATGSSTLDGKSQLLPRLYSQPTSEFHDVTSGNNSIAGYYSGYAASAGFDFVSGIGTPIANLLVPTLVAPSLPTGLIGTTSVVAPTGTVYELTTSGNLYSWSSPATAWTLQLTTVSSIQLSPSGTVFALQVNGNLNYWSGSAWVTATNNVNEFVFTASGTEFALLSNGTLLNANTGFAVLSNVSSLQVTPSGLAYALQTGGNLSFSSGSAWTLSISNVQTFGLTLSGTVYALLANGNLYNVTLNSTEATYVSQFVIAPNGDLYAIGEGGSAWRKTSSGWSPLSPGVVVHTLEIGPDGKLYGMVAPGTLSVWKNGSWASLLTGVSTFQVTTNGALYNLQTAGGLQQYNFYSGTWSTILTGVNSFQAAPDGLIFAQTTAGGISSWNGSSWSAALRTSVSSFAVASNGTLYDLQIGGTLERYNPSVGTWTTIATGISSFEFGPDSTVYMLTTAGALSSWSGSASTSVATGITSFQVLANGTLYVLASGSLKLYSAGTWTTIVANVVSFQQTPDSSLYVLVSGGTLIYLSGTSSLTTATGVTSYYVLPNGRLYVNNVYISG